MTRPNLQQPLVPVRPWGGVTRPLHRVATPATVEQAQRAIEGEASWLGHGLGRSYGDVALDSGRLLIDTRYLDHFISFDTDTGLIEAEAGVSLEDIIAVALPKGWFLPTTPGTKYVTLAGAIANDVHGKNHHVVGTFGNWVRKLSLLRSDGAIHDCSADRDAGLFQATIGGMGLTGLILRATLQLVRVPSAFVDAEDVVFRNLDEFFALSEESERDWEHTVSWMDCVGGNAGRGIFSRGNWSKTGDLTVGAQARKPRMPFNAPGAVLNPLTVKAFNTLYFHVKASKAGRLSQIHYEPFFYPLDGILNWNLFYGARGFYQYQCVVPRAVQRDAMKELLGVIAESGQASFLVVIKTFGDRPSPGLVSFPMPGANLALDFPNRGAKTLELMQRMDVIVAQAGGRIYPAKDQRMPASLFQSGYPRWRELAACKDVAVNSDFWRRVSTQEGQ